MLRKVWSGVRSAALGVYLLARRPPPGDQAKYDATARLYDDFFHLLWLIFGALTVEQALWRDLRPLLQPGQRLLDAGSGCGRLSRRIATLEPQVRLTLLDLSPEMLGLVANVPANAPCRRGAKSKTRTGRCLIAARLAGTPPRGKRGALTLDQGTGCRLRVEVTRWSRSRAGSWRTRGA